MEKKLFSMKNKIKFLKRTIMINLISGEWYIFWRVTGTGPPDWINSYYTDGVSKRGNSQVAVILIELKMYNSIYHFNLFTIWLLTPPTQTFHVLRDLYMVNRTIDCPFYNYAIYNNKKSSLIYKKWLLQISNIVDFHY